MKVKTISVTYGRKFNLGNYESAELSTTVWADLDREGDLPKEVSQALWAAAKLNVHDQANAIGIQGLPLPNSQVVERLAGKEVG
tara:strand:- start:301 stop:552 length:252 start_codon:yes stop_codon:yes gene_type:complete